MLQIWIQKILAQKMERSYSCESNQVQALNKTFQEVGECLNVDPATVQN